MRNSTRKYKMKFLEKVLKNGTKIILPVATVAQIVNPFNQLNAEEAQQKAVQSSLAKPEFYMPNNYLDMQVNADDLQNTTNSRDHDEGDILNPFAQPGDTLTAAYGSGDVNQDGQVNWDDYNEMVNNSPQNDYADIDGNGIASEQADMNLLEDFLTEEIGYLPGHWNALQTPEERQAWADSMLAIDPTDSIPYQNGNVEDRWISGTYSTQIYLNFFGYDGDDIHSKYDQSNIARFNLPIYQGVQYNPNTGLGHGMNMVLIGEDPTNIYDWAYIEPQTDAIFQINDTILNNLSELRLSIYGGEEFLQTSSPDMIYPNPIIKFNIDSLGSASIHYQNPNLVTSRPQNMPIIEPTLSIHICPKRFIKI